MWTILLLRRKYYSCGKKRYRLIFLGQQSRVYQVFSKPFFKNKASFIIFTIISLEIKSTSEHNMLLYVWSYQTMLTQLITKNIDLFLFFINLWTSRTICYFDVDFGKLVLRDFEKYLVLRRMEWLKSFYWKWYYQFFLSILLPVLHILILCR